MKAKILIIAVATTGLLLSSCEKDETEKDQVTFEDFTLGAEGYYNGSDLAGGFQIGNAVFNNSYNVDYSSWSGFAVSGHTDADTPGYGNQYSSIAGSGESGSDKYAVFYTWASDTIEFVIPEKVTSISVCNSTYTYYSMLDGDAYAKKFGGETGDDPDYFNLNIQGINETGDVVMNAVITLADYRFDDNSQDMIGNVWTPVDLSDAGFLKYLVFSFESSDMGDYGINTPTYVCIDNIYGELQD